MSRLSQEVTDCAAVIRRFLPAKIEIEGEEGAPGEVRIEPGR
jgi:hypothetical protein